jgi:opacity protein-like surface antigen
VKPNPFLRYILPIAFLASSITGQAVAQESPETYFALHGGLTPPQSFRHVRGVGPLSAVKLTDLKLERSAIYGAKLGFFLPGEDRWSGLEMEVFYTNPHIKQQDITFTGTGPPTTTNFAGGHVRIATWAVNWILRYPGEYFQPYVGVGPGIFWGRMSGLDLGTGSDTSLGLNALVGARIFLSQRLALFGEYKYNRVSFDFGGTAAIHVTYQPQYFVGGLSLHF